MMSLKVLDHFKLILWSFSQPRLLLLCFLFFGKTFCQFHDPNNNPPNTLYFYLSLVFIPVIITVNMALTKV